jgi:hypothetical protein
MLLWVPRHVGITGNVNADTATKEALNEQTQSIEKHRPQDLTKWIERKYQEEQQEKWNNRTTDMKECKKQQRPPKESNRDQNGSSGKKPTQNRLLQSNTRNDHEPSTQTRMHLLWSTIDDRPHSMAM